MPEEREQVKSLMTRVATRVPAVTAVPTMADRTMAAEMVTVVMVVVMKEVAAMEVAMASKACARARRCVRSFSLPARRSHGR